MSITTCRHALLIADGLKADQELLSNPRIAPSVLHPQYGPSQTTHNAYARWSL